MDVLYVYELLGQACRLLDESHDHAVAAYVGLGMVLLEDKYGLVPSEVSGGTITPPIADRQAPAGGCLT